MSIIHVYPELPKGFAPNIARRKKRRQRRGPLQGSGPARIPFEVILKMRRQWEAGGFTVDQIAEAFGVSTEYARLIVHKEARVFR